eukprot:TRINITY_DN8345_c0_g1_i1.p1 TRINITY_DN8345_c0_g1~~TRINITY_DN8345_c0_g1_i1.p1  ORF type:complete len:251 (-),score=34.60 TRINITY_DN8345_c0_g1_i1:36-788(-)
MLSNFEKLRASGLIGKAQKNGKSVNRKRPSSEISEEKETKQEAPVNSAKAPRLSLDDDSLDESKENEVTHVLAIDCEMVGVGEEGKKNALARCSLVNFYGKTIYDKFVKPLEKVTDYRTAVSGVRPADLEHALDFRTVQQEVSELTKNRILVGHAIHNDLRALMLDHPRHLIRDTSKFRSINGAKRARSLKNLAREHLGVEIQTGEHNSAADARIAMLLYQRFRNEWEGRLKRKQAVKSKSKPKKKKATS